MSSKRSQRAARMSKRGTKRVSTQPFMLNRSLYSRLTAKRLTGLLSETDVLVLASLIGLVG